MNWSEQAIEKEIRSAMKTLDIEVMPTHKELRELRKSGLSAALYKSGGIKRWSNQLGIPRRGRKPRKWTDEKIRLGIRKTMKALGVDRMPSANEFKDIGRNDLHCAISKHPLKYSGWAEKMGVEQKKSDTVKGQEYEGILEKILSDKGYEVERMTTKHAYDFLVNEHVKVDVKVGGAHRHYGSRCHTFRPSKKHPTCDLYICMALDEEEKVEKVFVIPSKFAQLVTLNICKESKYNAFIDRWDYIDRFTEFYKTLKVEGM